MRLSHVITLVAAGLLATPDVIMASNSKLSIVRSSTDEHSTILTKQFLRGDAARDEESEEKTINLSGLKSGALKIDDIDSLKIEAKSNTALKLDEAGDDIFQNPQLITMFSYMNSLNEKHPKTAMISTLVARYGDEPLVRMLEAAKKIEGMDEISTKLQNAQMWGWLNKKKSTDDVFELLKLNYGVEKLLTDKNLDIWVRYMHMFNKRYPLAQTTMVDTISNFYGDEVLAIALETAKKSPKTEKLATDLQVMHFNQWLMEGAAPAQIKTMLGRTKTASTTTPESKIYYAYKEFYILHQSPY